MQAPIEAAEPKLISRTNNPIEVSVKYEGEPIVFGIYQERIFIGRTLGELRELAGAWLLRHFKDPEAVIVYHDNNTRLIPHAYIVVNCTDLKAGRKLQTPNPEVLNRSPQTLAKESCLRAKLLLGYFIE